VRQTTSDDPAVQELQDAVRARAGTRAGDRWRTIQGTYAGQEALLVQRFSGGGTWETVQAFGLDGTLLVPDPADVWHVVGAPGEPVFGAGITDASGGNAYVGTRFRRRNGWVQVDININRAGGNGSPIFTLPVGFRPDGQMMFAANGANLQTITVDAAGVVSSSYQTANPLLQTIVFAAMH
jgi:hypothetical protein